MPQSQWTMWGPERSKAESVSIQEYFTITKDTGKVQNVAFVDPTRSVERYNKEVLGGSASFDEFINKARDREYGTWPTELSAVAVNDYIRGGFAFSGTSPLTGGVVGDGEQASLWSSFVDWVKGIFG